jgi:hypothetical protein
MLLLALDRSAVHIAALSEAQSKASLLPNAMSGFIAWLVPQMDTIPDLLSLAFEGARCRATAGNEHLRIPGILANLWLGIDYALAYAVEVGATEGAEAGRLRARCWDALLNVGKRQAQSVEGERPSRRFLTVLATLLAQRRAVLLDRDSRPDSHVGAAALVGRHDGEFIYLIPDAAFQAVARFCRDAGEFFPVRSERLLRDLNKEGLSDCAEGRNTTTVTLGGQKRRVVKIWCDPAEALIGETLHGFSNAGTERTARTASEV